MVVVLSFQINLKGDDDEGGEEGGEGGEDEKQNK